MSEHKMREVAATAPERLYLVIGFECHADSKFSELSEVTWCEDDIDGNGIAYVRADIANTLAAESQRLQATADQFRLLAKANADQLGKALAELAALKGAQAEGEALLREINGNVFFGNQARAQRDIRSQETLTKIRRHLVTSNTIPAPQQPGQDVAGLVAKFKPLADFVLRQAQFHNQWEKNEALAHELIALAAHDKQSGEG